MFENSDKIEELTIKYKYFMDDIQTNTFDRFRNITILNLENVEIDSVLNDNHIDLRHHTNLKQLKISPIKYI